MTRVPVIVTSSASNDDSESHVPHFCLHKSYTNAIVEAGGMPLMAVAHGDHDAFAKLVNIMDALFLPGGADIQPTQYHEEPSCLLKAVNQDRDGLELALIKAAREKGVPILGICRGMQLINVAYGGSLYQHIADNTLPGVAHDNRDTSIPRHYVAHQVTITPDSLLSRVIDTDTIPVNSRHHQAVKHLGEGLTVSAVAPDGVIEAIEDTNHPFILGIQWHPEDLRGHHPHAEKIFHAFVESARNGSGAHNTI